MLSFIPIDKKNVQEVKKQSDNSDNFVIKYLDGSEEIIPPPIQISVEKTSLGGGQWFWAVNSEMVIYCNRQI